MPRPIALIGIMNELAHLEARLSVERSQETPWGRLAMGRWSGSNVDVALASVAIGKIGAAMGAQAVIDAVDPRLLLNCGSAGALAPDLRVGDLVLGDPVLAHDQGVFLPVDEANQQVATRGDGFVLSGSTLPRSRRRSFRPAPALLGQALAAAQRAGLDRCQAGPIATGDQVVFEDGMKRWLHTAFAALAVENEGVAVAQVAHCHGLPWLVVRGISDSADNAASFDFTPLLAFEENGPPPSRLSRLLDAVHLATANAATLRQALRFRHGVQQAMANVVNLLDVLLPMLSSGDQSPN